MPQDIRALLLSLVGEEGVSITTRGGASFAGLKVVNLTNNLVFTVRDNVVNTFVVANIDRVDF